MYNFTTQHIQGSIRYSNGVLIGNWNEDARWKEAMLQELNEKRQRGELPADLAKTRLGLELKPCALTVREDGVVRFDDFIQIAHISGGRLCRYCPTTGAQETYTASATFECLQSVARNTFQIKKCPKSFLSLFDEDFEDEIVHYGQKVLVSTIDKELHLASASVSIYERTTSDLQQCAFFTPKITYSTVWQIRYIDPELWAETQGQNVESLKMIALVHCATNQALLFHSQSRFRTDCGIDNKVSVRSTYISDRRNCLDHENKGEVHGSERKRLSHENRWQIVVQTSHKEQS